MRRRIIHVDMDEFFAAVEKLDRPELRGKCILVGGDPKKRGVVSTASYEARAFGCHSAMPMARAVRICPQAVVVAPRGGRYRQVSDQVFSVFESFTPLIEPLSIDEAFLDMTGCERLFGPAEAIARQIKRAISRDVGLTASVGVAPNKFLAKLASDLDKPDGLTVIDESTVHEVLDPLPIRKLWGVGPAAAEALGRLNIRTIGELRHAAADLVSRAMGEMGEHFQRLAAGLDDRPVTPDSRAKSIGQEITFATDVSEMEALAGVLLGQVEQVSRRLRRHGLKARTITLKLRYGDFTTLTRSTTLAGATNVTADLWRAAEGLFDTWRAASGRPLRLLGVTASQLRGGAGEQLSLFADAAKDKQGRLDRATDEIARRFGPGAVGRAAAQRRGDSKA